MSRGDESDYDSDDVEIEPGDDAAVTGSAELPCRKCSECGVCFVHRGGRCECKGGPR